MVLWNGKCRIGGKSLEEIRLWNNKQYVPPIDLKVVLDEGASLECLDGEIETLVVQGNINGPVTVGGNVWVKGSVQGHVKTDVGKIIVAGSVSGDARIQTGSIHASVVMGNAKTVTGSVRAYDSKDVAGKKAVALAVENALTIQTTIDAVDKIVESKLAKTAAPSAPRCDQIGSPAPVSSSCLQQVTDIKEIGLLANPLFVPKNDSSFKISAPESLHSKKQSRSRKRPSSPVSTPSQPDDALPRNHKRPRR